MTIVDPSNPTKSEMFNFDLILDSQSNAKPIATQQTVWETLGVKVLRNALDGTNLHIDIQIST